LPFEHSDCFVGLAHFLLPLLSGLELSEQLLQSEALIGVLGLAYLLALFFDRLADTILSPIEQWLRLRLANRFLEKRSLYCMATIHFPQDILEYSLRGDKNGRVDWMDLCAAGFAPVADWRSGAPGSDGIAIFRSVDPGSQVRWSWWPHLAVAVNLV